MTDLFSTVQRIAGTAPDRSWPDQDLVSACREGDARAWEALVEKYKNLVYSVPFRYGAQPDDAADIFQNVWIDLHNELPRLRNVDALRSWLITVASRHSLRWKRRGQSRGEAELPESDHAHPGDERPLAADTLEQMERDQLVRESVSALPERCRGMVEMLFLSDPPVPYQEVAAHFGLATGSIGFIRGRCLDKLRKELEARGVSLAESRS